MCMLDNFALMRLLKKLQHLGIFSFIFDEL